MGWFERAFMIAFGLLFAVGAFQKDARMRYSRSGPWTYTVTPFGRVCWFLLGALLIFVGVTQITEFWYFSQ